MKLQGIRLLKGFTTIVQISLLCSKKSHLQECGLAESLLFLSVTGPIHIPRETFWFYSSYSSNLERSYRI